MVMGELVDEVDVAVVGGAPGGYSAAFRCAELGLETVVIDADGRLGGACLFEGCIPSKALLHVAAVVSEAERARGWGVDFGEPRISLDQLRKWKQERVVGKLARGLASVAKGKGVTVIGGRAVFEETGKWPSQATARTPQRRAYEAEYRSRPETKAKSVAKQRRYRYGITDDEYAAMVLASGGLCAICNEAMGDDICVDHCHDSGAVRGLLCRNCNFGLGHFRDDPARLTAALAYLTA